MAACSPSARARVLVAGDGRDGRCRRRSPRPAGRARRGCRRHDLRQQSRELAECLRLRSTTASSSRSIGKAGGRPAMGQLRLRRHLGAAGLAVDKAGQLWVAGDIDSPKRISVWNAATGRFGRSSSAASSYFGYAYMDPAHPDEIYCHNVLWKVDLGQENVTTRISTIWRDTAPNMIEPPGPSGYAGHFRVITGGQRQAVRLGHGGLQPHALHARSATSSSRSPARSAWRPALSAAESSIRP